MTKLKKALAMLLCFSMLGSMMVVMPASAANTFTEPNEAATYQNTFKNADVGGEWLQRGGGALIKTADGLQMNNGQSDVGILYDTEMGSKYVFIASLKSVTKPVIPAERDGRRVGMLGLRQLTADGIYQGDFPNTGYNGILIQIYEYDATGYTLLFPNGESGGGTKTAVQVDFPSGVKFDDTTPVRFAVEDTGAAIMIYVNEQLSATITLGTASSVSVKPNDQEAARAISCHTTATVTQASGDPVNVTGAAIPAIGESSFGFAYRGAHDSTGMILSDIKFWDDAAISGVSVPDTIVKLNVADVVVSERLETTRVKYQCGTAGLGYLTLVETDYETGAFLSAVSNAANDVKSISIDISPRSVVKAYKFSTATTVTAENYTSEAVTSALVNSSVWTPDSDPSFIVAGAFADHMVLQRGMPVQVWGWSKHKNGTEITVSVDGKSATATVNNGEWMATLPAMEANTVGQTMTVTDGDDTVTFEDVLIGDVYFVDGQSNMDQVTFANSETYGEDIHRTENENIRLYFTSHEDIHTMGNLDGLIPEYTSAPRRNSVNNRTWEVSSRTTAGKFSGVSYYAALYLAEARPDVPVGMIQVAYTGSSLAQLSPASVNEPFYTSETNPTGGISPDGRTYQDAKRYNGLMAPVEKYTARGMLWYQGYTDAWTAWHSRRNGQPENNIDSYPARHQAFMDYMKDATGNEDFMAYMVQLTSFGYSDQMEQQDKAHPWFRAMQMTMMDDDMLIATAMDDGFSSHHGDTDRLHPPHNKIIGTRMGTLIRENVFGDISKDNARSPWPASYTGEATEGAAFSFDATGVTIKYTNVGEGLALASETGDRLLGFELVKDGVAYRASAEIVGTDTVRVTGIANPDAVRYGYYVEVSKYAANLVNSNGYAATAFAYPYDKGVAAPVLDIGYQEGAQPQLRYKGATLAFADSLQSVSADELSKKWTVKAGQVSGGAQGLEINGGGRVAFNDVYDSYIAQFTLTAEEAGTHVVKLCGDTVTASPFGTSVTINGSVAELPAGVSYNQDSKVDFEVVREGTKIELYAEGILVYTGTVSSSAASVIEFSAESGKMIVSDFTLWHKLANNIEPETAPDASYAMTTIESLTHENITFTQPSAAFHDKMGLEIKTGQIATVKNDYDNYLMTADLILMDSRVSVGWRLNAPLSQDGQMSDGLILSFSPSGIAIIAVGGESETSETIVVTGYPTGSCFGTVQLGIRDTNNKIEIYVDGTLVATITLSGMSNGVYTSATITPVVGSPISYTGLSIPVGGDFIVGAEEGYLKDVNFWELPATEIFDTTGMTQEYNSANGALSGGFSTALTTDSVGGILGTKGNANGTMTTMYNTARTNSNGYAISTSLVSGPQPNPIQGDGRRVTTLSLRQTPNAGLVSGNFPDSGYMGVAIQFYNYDANSYTIIFKNGGGSGKAVEIPLPNGVTFNSTTPINLGVIDTENEIKIYINGTLSSVVTLLGETTTGLVEFNDGAQTTTATYYKKVSVTDYTGATTSFDYAVVPTLSGSTFGLGMRCGHNSCYVQVKELTVWKLPKPTHEPISVPEYPTYQMISSNALADSWTMIGGVDKKETEMVLTGAASALYNTSYENYVLTAKMTPWKTPAENGDSRCSQVLGLRQLAGASLSNGEGGPWRNGTHGILIQFTGTDGTRPYGARNFEVVFIDGRDISMEKDNYINSKKAKWASVPLPDQAIYEHDTPVVFTVEDMGNRIKIFANGYLAAIITFDQSSIRTGTICVERDAQITATAKYYTSGIITDAYGEAITVNSNTGSTMGTFSEVTIPVTKDGSYESFFGFGIRSGFYIDNISQDGYTVTDMKVWDLDAMFVQAIFKNVFDGVSAVSVKEGTDKNTLTVSLKPIASQISTKGTKVVSNKGYFKGWQYSDNQGNRDTYVLDYYTLKQDATTVNKALTAVAENGLKATFTAIYDNERSSADGIISEARAQKVTKDDDKSIRFLAMLDESYMNDTNTGYTYSKVGFVLTDIAQNPTIEAGFQYSTLTKVYRQIKVNDKTFDAQNTDLQTTFGGFENGRAFVYTTLKIKSGNESKTYYATPYVEYVDDDGNTQRIYGKTKAVSYAELENLDAQQSA